MIDPLTIGAGLTLFALGAGGTWAVMRVRIAVLAERERAASIGLASRTLDYLGERKISNALNEASRETRAAHARCADALATKQRILDDLADYLRGQKSGTAVKALRMIEERHL